MVPNWAGTGRDLAIVSNGLFGSGYYQAIAMLEVGSVSVPNVVGLTQSAATTAITGAGLVVGTVTQQSSATVPAGSVISQNPAAGTSVAAGSAVNLVVSTGPALGGGAERGGPDAVGGDDRDHGCGTGAGHGDAAVECDGAGGQRDQSEPGGGRECRRRARR